MQARARGADVPVKDLHGRGVAASAGVPALPGRLRDLSLVRALARGPRRLVPSEEGSKIAHFGPIQNAMEPSVE